jgi:hypothetical protein
MRIIQEELVQDIPTAGNQTGVLIQCKDKRCIVSTPLPAEFFAPERPNFVSVQGIALAQVRSKLRGIQEAVEDDASPTIEMSFETDIALALRRFPLQAIAREDGNEINGGGTKVVAWLIPLSLLLFLCCLCLCSAYRRQDSMEVDV